MADNDGLVIPISVTERQYLQSMAKIEAATVRAAKRTENTWRRANTSSNRSMASLERGFRKTTGAANQFSGGMRNVSLQLSQVAQQASVTGDPIRALAIQLPDLAIGFGALGIAIGAVAGPALLLATNLLQVGGNAEELDETIDDLGQAIDRYEAAADRAATPTRKLKEEYGALADQARALFDAQAALEKLEVISQLQTVRSGLSDQFGSLAGFDAQDFKNAGIALEGLLGRLRELREGATPITDDEGQRIQAQINTLGQLAEVIRRVQVELGLGAREAGNFAAALATFRDADAGTVAQADALRQVRELLLGALTDTGRLTEEQEVLARSIVDTEENLLGFVAALADAEKGAIDVSDAVDGISFDNATQGARELADQLGISLALASSLERFERRRVAEETPLGLNPIRPESFPGLPGKGVVVNPPPRTPRSRRGGGGSASSETPFFDATDKQIENLKRQGELLGQTEGRVAELNAKWELLAEAKRRNLDLDERQAATGQTLRQEIEAQAKTIGNLTEAQAAAADQAQFMEETQRSLQDGLIDSIVEGKNLTGVLEDLAKSLAKAALQAALFGDGPLSGAFGTSGSGGAFGGLLGSLLGSILPSRGAGGPVRAGQPYQVGEHGRELFVPRTDGQIMNASQLRQINQSVGAGGSTQNLAVHIHENARDGQTEVRQSPGRVDVFLRKTIGDVIRGGGADSAMRSRYGVRPQAQGA